MLSKIITAPFLIAAIVFLYLTLNVDDKYSWYIVPNVIALVLIYMMSPQIDWWWYQRRPPKLPEGIVKIFLSRLPFFKKLSPADKTKFCTRVALYMEANEFMPKGMESVPLDIKAVIAASAVQLTFNRENYLMDKFEHIIVYPHPFPSPQYKGWHASEIYEEDGVIMFSAEQLMAGFAQPKQYFHTGLYEYAKVFMRCHPDIEFPEFNENIWPQFQQISNFPKTALENVMGLKNLDLKAIGVVYYLIFAERFKIILPKEFNALENIFHGRRI